MKLRREHCSWTVYFKMTEEKKKTLKEQRDDLKKELRGTQEMLFLVLSAVGRPVTVTSEALSRGFDNRQIVVENDVESSCWVFSVEEESEE